MTGAALFTLKALSFVLGHLPLGVALVFGRLVGAILYRLDGKHRKIAMANLDLAYGDSITRAEKERITRGVFTNLGLLVFEFMRIPWLTRKRLEGYVDTSQLKKVDAALARGRGAFMFTAHFGNWELMAASYGFMGYPVDVVARELDSPAVERFTRWVRTRSGNGIVTKGRAMRQLLKSLKANRVVGILLDQNVAMVEGVFVDFFSTPACTNKGPAILAAASGAAVFPTFIVREEGRHTIVVGDEIPLADTGDRERDAATNTARFTSAIEEMVRKHPDQWFWIHRRWKTRPEGEAKDLEKLSSHPLYPR